MPPLQTTGNKPIFMPRAALLAIFLVFLSNFCLTPPARAQDPQSVRVPKPTVEIYMGYSDLSALTVGGGLPLNLSGGDLSFAYFLSPWLGLVADTGFNRQANIAPSGFSLNVYSYQFGARIRLRTYHFITPFVQGMVGGGHAGGTSYTHSQGDGLPPLGSSNGHTLTGGGGLDWRLGNHVEMRLIQVEYFRTNFINGDNNANRQRNYRLSSGLVFTFGKH